MAFRSAITFLLIKNGSKGPARTVRAGQVATSGFPPGTQGGRLPWPKWLPIMKPIDCSYTFLLKILPVAMEIIPRILFMPKPRCAQPPLIHYRPRKMRRQLLADAVYSQKDLRQLPPEYLLLFNSLRRNLRSNSRFTAMELKP